MPAQESLLPGAMPTRRCLVPLKRSAARSRLVGRMEGLGASAPVASASHANARCRGSARAAAHTKGGCALAAAVAASTRREAAPAGSRCCWGAAGTGRAGKCDLDWAGLVIKVAAIHISVIKPNLLRPLTVGHTREQCAPSHLAGLSQHPQAMREVWAPAEMAPGGPPSPKVWRLSARAAHLTLQPRAQGAHSGLWFRLCGHHNSGLGCGHLTAGPLVQAMSPPA
jgi:hypothetical protein